MSMTSIYIIVIVVGLYAGYNECNKKCKIYDEEELRKRRNQL